MFYLRVRHSGKNRNVSTLKYWGLSTSDRCLFRDNFKPSVRSFLWFWGKTWKGLWNIRALDNIGSRFFVVVPSISSVFLETFDSRYLIWLVRWDLIVTSLISIGMRKRCFLKKDKEWSLSENVEISVNKSRRSFSSFKMIVYTYFRFIMVF